MNKEISRNKQPYFKFLNKVFNDTYWSRHTPIFSEVEEKQLCSNRELMADEYSLKKFYWYYGKFPKKYWKELIIGDLTDVEREMSIVYRLEKVVKQAMRIWVQNHNNIIKHKDHMEYYTDIDKNIVSVFSKYITDDDTETLELIEKSGYKRINPIYDLDQKTFIKVIQKY